MAKLDKVDILFLAAGRSLDESSRWKERELERARALRLKDINLRRSCYLLSLGVGDMSIKEAVDSVRAIFTCDEALAAWHLSGEQARQLGWINEQKDYSNYLSERIEIRSAEMRRYLERLEEISSEHLGKATAFSKRLAHYAKQVRLNQIELPVPLGKGPLERLVELERLGPKGRGGGHILTVPAYLHVAMQALAVMPHEHGEPSVDSKEARASESRVSGGDDEDEESVDCSATSYPFA